MTTLPNQMGAKAKWAFSTRRVDRTQAIGLGPDVDAAKPGDLVWTGKAAGAEGPWQRETAVLLADPGCRARPAPGADWLTKPPASDGLRASALACRGKALPGPATPLVITSDGG